MMESLAKRKPREWAARLLLAGAVATLGYGMAVHATAQLLRGRSLQTAHRLAPWDGRITGRLAEYQGIADVKGGKQVSSARLAREALLQDPTSVLAIAVLGTSAQISGDVPRARRLFAYSDQLSRRHLGTRLWLIEDAVAQGQIARALQHYDVALRTSNAAAEVLFPILSSAIAHAEIRTELVKTLARGPVWSKPFIDYSAWRGSNPQATAALLTALGRAGVPVEPRTHALLIDTLMAKDRPGEAWAFYRSIRPGVDPAESRDPQFKLDRGDATVFDWRPTEEAGFATAMQDGLFDFAAPPSVGGLLLRQVQRLPAGRYRISGRSQNLDQPSSSLPYWTLTCHKGSELGRVPVPASTEQGGRFTGSFIVPQGCSTQYLDLIARPSNAVAGLTGQVTEVTLVRWTD